MIAAGPSESGRPACNPGCSTPLLVGVGFLAILLTTQLIHQIGYYAEQFIFALGYEWPRWTWLAISVGYSLLFLIPLATLARRTGDPTRQAILATWSAAALFVLVLAPARLTGRTADQVANLWHIALVALYLACLWLVRRRATHAVVSPPVSAGGGAAVGLALLLGPLMAYGWLALGALGSLLDVLLNLAVAVLFGLAASRAVQPLLRLSRPAGPPPLILDGLVIAGALGLMASAVGANGLPLLLLVAVPVVGWAAAALAHMAGGDWRPLALLIALAIAPVLLFVDPEELLLVLNAGTRDVLTWVRYAAWLSLAVALIGGFLFRRLAARPQVARHSALLGAAALVWLVGAGLYFLVGQPGLHGDRLFVILNDQTDVSAAATIADYDARRHAVYEALVAHAATTQAPLRQWLDRYRLDYTPYYLVNALDVGGDPLLAWWLERRPDVDRVLLNPVLRPLPAPPPPAVGEPGPPPGDLWNLAAIGADRVWQELGVTGRGIVVGQSDSGVQGDHPELASAYRGRDGDHAYNWYDPWYDSRHPTDIGGHGTHTLGSVLGRHVGVAPDASWFGCVNLARNLGNPALYLDCMQFMLAPFPRGGDPFTDGDPSRAAHVLNNSWGCPAVEGCDPTVFQPAVRALRAAGLFVVVSAGNEGGLPDLINCASMDSPLALYDEVFTVGARDDNGTIAPFSSRGPVTADGSERVKPDIIAPGVNILSSFPGDTYIVLEGTSMAGPHVAGVVALMWSANRDLIGDVERTEQILIATARPYEGPRWCGGPDRPSNDAGHGLLDAYGATLMALSAGN